MQIINRHNLIEDYMLLLIDEKRKFLIDNDHILKSAISGATLLELILQGRLSIAEEGVLLIDETNTSDSLLDMVLDIFKSNPESIHRTKYWIRSLFSDVSNLKHFLTEYLSKRGLISVEQTKIFFIFPSKRYTILKQDYVTQLKEMLLDVKNTKEIDPREIGLLSLLYATNMANNVFSSEDLDELIDTIRGLVAGEEVGQSVSQAIWDITEAMMRTFITYSYVS